MSTFRSPVVFAAALAAFIAPPALHAQAQPSAREAPSARVAPSEPAAASRDAADASAAARSAQSNAELERELAAARERLEAAARDVAALSGRLAGEDVLRLRAGAARRAMLGVQLGEPAPKGGVRVRTVSPGGPAAEAGLQGGDVIVAIDGQKIRDAAQLSGRVRALVPGTTTKLDVERDGRVRTYAVVTRALDPRVVLLMRPGDIDLDALDAVEPLEPPEAPVRFPFPGFGPWGDLEFATLTKDLGRYFGAEKGVLVVRAGDAALQLRDGDVITAIDGREPQSGSHALRILRSYQPGEKLSLAVLRDRRAMRLDVTVPAGARQGFRAPSPATPSKPATPSAPDPADPS